MYVSICEPNDPFVSSNGTFEPNAPNASSDTLDTYIYLCLEAMFVAANAQLGLSTRLSPHLHQIAHIPT